MYCGGGLNTVLTCDELEAILASLYRLMAVLVLEMHHLDLDVGGVVLWGWGVVNTTQGVYLGWGIAKTTSPILLGVSSYSRE